MGGDDVGPAPREPSLKPVLQKQDKGILCMCKVSRLEMNSRVRVEMSNMNEWGQRQGKKGL